MWHHLHNIGHTHYIGLSGALCVDFLTYQCVLYEYLPQLHYGSSVTICIWVHSKGCIHPPLEHIYIVCFQYQVQLCI